MKKKLHVFLICLVLFFSLPLTSAFAEAPMQNVLISSEGVLTWDEVPGAEQYTVMIANSGVNSSTTSCDLKAVCQHMGLERGTYNISLQAFDALGTPLTQQWAGSYTYTSEAEKLATPTNLRWDDTTARWDAIEKADYYLCSWYENGVYQLSNICYVCSDSISIVLGTGAEYYFTIKACSNGEFINSDIAVSSVKTFALPPLRNVEISEEGILTWDEVPEAEKYAVTIHTAGGFLTTTSYNLKYICQYSGWESGTYNVSLQALGALGIPLTEQWKGTYSYLSEGEKLATPTNLRWDVMTARWDAVEKADYYLCSWYKDGSFQKTNVCYTSFDSTGISFETERQYHFCVEACSDGEFINSDRAKSQVKIFNTLPIHVTCTISFYMNGHGTQIPAQIIEKNSKAVNPTEPTEEGWLFCGWYTDPAFSAAFDFSSDITEDTILFAKWAEDVTKPKEITVSYDANGGKGQMSPETYALDEDGMAKNYITPPCKFTEPSGKEFDHWEASLADGSLTFIPVIGEITWLWQSVTLKAVWRTRQTPVRTDVLIAAADCRIDIPVAGATADINPVAADTGKYTVSFLSCYEVNDPNRLTAATFEGGKSYVIRLVYKAKEGFKFNDSTSFTINGEKTRSWQDAVGYREIVYFVPVDDVPKTYIVSFIMNGHGAPIAVQTVKEHDKATQPPDPAASGYDFKGWYVGPSFTTEFDFDTVISADTKLYAKWGQKDLPAVEQDASITEDNHNILAWLALLLMGSASLAAVVVINRRKKKSKGNH